MLDLFERHARMYVLMVVSRLANKQPITQVDFQSIQRIGDSLKKEESRGAKTGRFGVGFNRCVDFFPV